MPNAGVSADAGVGASIGLHPRAKIFPRKKALQIGSRRIWSIELNNRRSDYNRLHLFYYIIKHLYGIIEL